jgi:hypothetical protein
MVYSTAREPCRWPLTNLVASKTYSSTAIAGLLSSTAAISSGKEGYLSMVLAWFCLTPPRASQSNNQCCSSSTTQYVASQTRMHPQRPSAHAPVMISWVPHGWPGFTCDDKTGQISTTIQSNNHFVPIAIGHGFDVVCQLQILGSIQHTGQVPHTHVPPATPPHMPIQYDMMQHAQQPAAAPAAAAATAQDSTTRSASTAPRPPNLADQALRRAATQHLHVQQASAPATSLTKPPVHTNSTLGRAQGEQPTEAAALLSTDARRSGTPPAPATAPAQSEWHQAAPDKGNPPGPGTTSRPAVHQAVYDTGGHGAGHRPTTYRHARWAA